MFGGFLRNLKKKEVLYNVKSWLRVSIKARCGIHGNGSIAVS